MTSRAPGVDLGSLRLDAAFCYGQGRPDLTRELLLERHDGFLRSALDQLHRAGRVMS